MPLLLRASCPRRILSLPLFLISLSTQPSTSDAEPIRELPCVDSKRLHANDPLYL